MGGVAGVTFSPDGHTLATSSYGQTVRLWETDENRAGTEVCALASPPITREQWNRYLPGYAYRPPCSPPARVAHGRRNEGTQPGLTLLVATHSDKCVAIKGGLPVPVAPAYQATCTRTAGRDWNLQRTAVTGPDGGAVYHIRNTSTGMCLDSLTSERRVGDASVIVQRPCLDEALSQLWKFDVVRRHAELSDGRFVNLEHGDCLNVNGGAATDGAPVVRWQCGNDPNGIFQVSADALER